MSLHRTSQTMNTKHSTAPAPAAATHELVAHPLALDTARGFAALVIAATVATGAVAGAVLVHPAFALVLVLASIPAVYGWALLANLKAERRRFYAREVRDQRDYDGDGVVGEPAGHIVNIAGRETILPDLDPPKMTKPAPPLVGFPVCANDVLFVIDRASRDGCGFRAWKGERLPSGAVLSADLWRSIQDGLVKWQFATARETKAGRVVELRTDVELEIMLDAVRKGVG